MSNPIPTTTPYAVKKIAEDLDTPHDLVKSILDSYLDIIIECLSAEIPFSFNGLGKFFFSYRGDRAKFPGIKKSEFYNGKVHRELKFTIAAGIRARLNGWVHDLGIKNNIDKKELLRLAIKPEEIVKLRRSRILEEQRAIGFRSELLFDEDTLPEHDRSIASDSDNAPSLGEVMQRLGINIDEI